MHLLNSLFTRLILLNTWNKIAVLIVSFLLITDFFLIIMIVKNFSTRPEPATIEEESISNNTISVTEIPTAEVTEPPISTPTPTKIAIATPTPVRPTHTPIPTPTQIPSPTTNPFQYMGDSHTFQGVHIDANNNPVLIPGQKVTVTQESTGKVVVSTTSSPTWSSDKLEPGTYIFKTDDIPGYRIDATICSKCNSPGLQSFTNGGLFYLSLPEGYYYGIYFRYTPN